MTATVNPPPALPTSESTRELVLARTMAQLADTLVDDFDVVDVLTTLSDGCIDVLDITAAGIMLAGPKGDLSVLASSSTTMRAVELFELQSQEGPCLDCYRSGQPVTNEDLSSANDLWPSFSPIAVEAGFLAASAVPLRLRGQVIGALNLFDDDPGPMSDRDAVVAQALADVATIAILQHRTALEAQVVTNQLSQALDSRVVIEQAKGMIAAKGHLPLDQAFARLRSYARSRSARLADVARAVVDGTLDLAAPGTVPD